MNIKYEGHKNSMKDILNNKENWKYTHTIKEKEYKYFCICGHNIINLCHIENDKTNEVDYMGNCCIKSILPKENYLKSFKKCIICEDMHKNKKDDFCNRCRGMDIDFWKIIKRENKKDYFYKFINNKHISYGVTNKNVWIKINNEFIKNEINIDEININRLVMKQIYKLL
jgi:hypothetical protein